ncbi:AAA family ATPase [Streptococcus suis]|nr:AAA family ATPase [Streptococcus suis]
MKEKLVRGVKTLVDKVNNISLISSKPNDSIIFEELKSNFNQTSSIFIKEIEDSNIDSLYSGQHINVYFEEVYNEIDSSLQCSLDNFSSFDFPDSVGDSETFKFIIDQAKSDFENIRYTLLKYENIPLLNELISESQTVILVGKNGVGKSTLIDDLKTDKFHNLFCIPAQKYLYLTSVSSEKVDNIEGIHRLFTSNPLKIKTTISYIGADGDPYRIFSLILNFVMREHQKCKSDQNSATESKLDKIVSLFSSIFENISLRTDSMNGTIEAEQFHRYNINSMSDGEKSALFYISCAVLAKENTIFVIDEPETHLNIAICNKLWDLILDYRQDCKFVFVSHNSDFIAGRVNPRIVWCKKYVNNTEFDLQPLNSLEIDFSRQLLIELVGSRKPILFCEGTMEGIDYQLYNILYSDSYLIKPVGGHLDVVNNVRALNKLTPQGIEGIGLIDCDFHSTEKLVRYKKEKIYSLPVNEIEMLLMHEAVINAVLEDANTDKTFEDVKRELKQQLSSRLDFITGTSIKNKLEEILSIENIKNKKDGETQIELLIQKLEPIVQEFDTEKEKNQQILDSGDYATWLSICNLKKEITVGFMNSFENDYQFRAFNKIKKNNDLQQILKDFIALPEIEKTD